MDSAQLRVNAKKRRNNNEKERRSQLYCKAENEIEREMHSTVHINSVKCVVYIYIYTYRPYECAIELNQSP